MVGVFFVAIIIIINIILGIRAFIFASELKAVISANSSSMTILHAIQNEILTSSKNSLLPLKSKKANEYYNRAKNSLRIMYLATIACILFNYPGS